MDCIVMVDTVHHGKVFVVNCSESVLEAFADRFAVRPDIRAEAE